MWQLLPPLALGLQTTLRYNATERSSFLEMQQFPGFAAASYFKQKLDHFLPADTRTFDQRYFESRSYWAGPQAVPDPPVFFYIGGEAPLYGLPSGWVDELAKEHGALLVAFEHRFYGKSQPFDAITTDNLAYLSTAQALLDIMSFRGFFTDELRRAGGSGSGPWFAFGGSYAGALAAWLRAFFPGQFAGAIASSGVVQLELGYWRFDRQVAASCGPQCAQVMTYVYGVIDAMLEDPQRNQWVKDRFAAGALTDGDFRYLLADAGSMAVQYGFSERLCAPMVQAATGAGGSVEPLLDAFSNYAQTHFYSTLETGSSEEYSTRYLQQTQASEEKSARTWLYQTCSELGWFQVAPADSPMRSANLTLAYFKAHCAEVFGRDLWPDVEAGNANTGGARLRATNLYFVNGGQDPWQHVSVTTPAADGSIGAGVMACEGCSHCRDLKSSSWDDPEQVRAVKAEAGQRLSAWIDGARGGAAAAAQGRVPVQQQQQAQNVLQNVLQPLGWPGGGI
eukprot:Transcript_20379.p1 GENE.Transcript_20379~~Transcript_20379.p1  ORF type:complete len:507 (+),score=215.31 Transcript_20379:150-1670(+)